MDIHQILKQLPHRYPFLLVDRLLAVDPGKSIKALKNVTINEPFFMGHFPHRPVMPGVLMLEAMAQTAGLLAFADETGSRDPNSVIYFVGIDAGADESASWAAVAARVTAVSLGSIVALASSRSLRPPRSMHPMLVAVCLIDTSADGLVSAATTFRSAPALVADAAMRGDLTTVKKLIAQGVCVNAAQGDGMTALHWAADRADSALANTLVRAKANVRADIASEITTFIQKSLAASEEGAPAIDPDNPKTAPMREFVSNTLAERVQAMINGAAVTKTYGEK
jgi:hypothetical protein